MKKILIVSKTDYFKKKIKKKNFFFIQNEKSLNLKFLDKLNPSIIFFPHWSYRVSENIINKYLCIGFHATPLPYGRGGSPIQNMIIRGFSNSKLCAFKINDKLDAGPIYKKVPISLRGSADEIFKNSYEKIYKIIINLCKKLPEPKKQIGQSKYFKRRKPEESVIKINSNIVKLYDFIRMLDVSEKNFPKAFLKIGKIKYEFSNAKKKGSTINANVLIKKINL